MTRYTGIKKMAFITETSSSQTEVKKSVIFTGSVIRDYSAFDLMLITVPADIDYRISYITIEPSGTTLLPQRLLVTNILPNVENAICRMGTV